MRSLLFSGYLEYGFIPSAGIDIGDFISNRGIFIKQMLFVLQNLCGLAKHFEFFHRTAFQ